jgi:HAD superfamily hydrolase (TIGR01509 family)
MAQTNEWFKIQSPFEGVVSLLDKMSKEYSTYIVTTKARETVLALLNYHKINFPEEKILTKPHVETKDILIKEIAEKEKVLISQIILIDDALKQLVNAKQIGAKTILAMWGEKREVFEIEAKNEGIKIAYSPSECKSIIKAL